MKKKIIIIKGKSNVGKSSTIRRLVKEKFKIKFYDKRKEIAMKIEFQGKIIIILSIGDRLNAIKKTYLKEIKKDTNNFKNYFDYLICTSRTKGSILDYYRKQKKENVDIDEEIIKEKDKKNGKDEERVIGEIWKKLKF